jgi:transcriptional regulator GlxA family with amidase domain
VRRGAEKTCSNGATFRLDMGLEEMERDDTVLVCGGIDVQRTTTKGILNWLRREARRGVTMGGPVHRRLCAGQGGAAGRQEGHDPLGKPGRFPKNSRM